ncbi:hypothetical protein DYB31_012506 [Aphanomyces astaci]|uniref:Uncharacterized protein n=1 Tax=Aphanomyces astaci TaxID=112090 RepID=A0A397EV84_APHAT|nr:hypothetical protein DYB31_012506 [Aphanomyces astaci]
MLWCDRSVATLFSLRYNSPLASRFDSKNNSGKRVAYVMLAAVLSVEMQREFVAKQAQDKPQAAPGATLDDVLSAIKAQSDTMTQLLAHLVAQKKD